MLCNESPKRSDFVEEESSAVGEFDLSGPTGVRPGKRAFLVPEEFRLHQGLWQSRAINADERRAVARTQRDDGASHKLFSRAALAPQHYGTVPRGHATDGLIDSPHMITAADQSAEGVLTLDLLSQPFGLQMFGPRLGSLEQIVAHLGEVDRSQQELVSSGSPRSLTGLGQRVAGDCEQQGCGRGGPHVADVGEEILPVGRDSIDVNDNNFGITLTNTGHQIVGSVDDADEKRRRQVLADVHEGRIVRSGKQQSKAVCTLGTCRLSYWRFGGH